MRVQATKVFARELNKAAKGNYCIDQIILEKIPRINAYLMVGGGYNDNDIDWDTDTVKVIKVIYKPDMYAMPRYITTRDLGKLFIDGMKLDEYTRAFLEEYAI